MAGSLLENKVLPCMVSAHWAFEELGVGQWSSTKLPVLFM
jgi:hypothetical protein